MVKKKKINIIELDSRDARFQTGIGRYIETLTANMPDNINVFQIIFLFSPQFKDIHIEVTERAAYVQHPVGFPAAKLFDATIAMLGPRLVQMENLIVKSNCLGVEGLAYMIRSQFYCKCVGVLHCLPHCSPHSRGQFPMNPFFNMDAVVSVCAAGTDYLKMVKNSRPVSVIYNGLLAPRIQKKTAPADGVFRFIFSNGWAHHKGFHRIVPAIRAVAEKHRISVMVLGGGADMDDNLKAQIADLPIETIGWITDAADVDKYYNMADCALFASYSEACSYAGIEAMAYNLPIVSSDAIGLAEMFGKKAAIIVGNTKDGELDTDAYANAMCRIITSSSLRLRLGVAAYARYREHYTMKKMAAEYINLYNRLVG